MRSRRQSRSFLASDQPGHEADGRTRWSGRHLCWDSATQLATAGPAIAQRPPGRRMAFAVLGCKSGVRPRRLATRFGQARRPHPRPEESASSRPGTTCPTVSGTFAAVGHQWPEGRRSGEGGYLLTTNGAWLPPLRHPSSALAGGLRLNLQTPCQILV